VYPGAFPCKFIPSASRVKTIFHLVGLTPRDRLWCASQIVNILRQIELASANGKMHSAACREGEIAEQAFYCRRKHCGGLKADQDKMTIRRHAFDKSGSGKSVC
jgi:hypothetical protein